MVPATVFGKYQVVMDIPEQEEDESDDEYGDRVSDYLYDETVNHLKRSDLNGSGWLAYTRPERP